MERKMKEAYIIGKILYDLLGESENEYEALDMYASWLYKRLKIKEKAGINNVEDINVYKYLQAIKDEIALKTAYEYQLTKIQKQKYLKEEK